jgi:hypothetical protein
MTLNHISRPLRTVTGKTFARKYVTLGKVMALWTEVAGPDLARRSYPIGMKVRKTGAKKNDKDARQLEAVLEIGASSADATLLHYQKPLLLERLKNLLGDTIIVDIMVVHRAPVSGSSASLTPAIPLTLPQKTCLSPLPDTIQDPDLREALEGLGRWIET